MTSIHGAHHYTPVSFSKQNVNITQPKQSEDVQKEYKNTKNLSVKEEDIHYGNKLSPEAKKHIAELKAVEREVIAHEQAHQSVGGNLAGGISYKYQKGPDGQQYAVGGEVPIQMPEGKTPEETINIMEQVRRAALAPAQPSAQDLQVAAKASQRIMSAQTELSKSKEEEPTEAAYTHAIQRYQENQNGVTPETMFDISA